MKTLKINRKFAILGLLILLLCTYFRENFLLAINANLASFEFNRAYSYWCSDFFQKMDTCLLIKWKWGITIFFSLIMSAITILSLFVWFKSKEALKIILFSYVIFFFLVCFLSIIGFFTNTFNDLYFVLRKILGIVQSPFPFFIFFILFYWSNKNKQP